MPFLKCNTDATLFNDSDAISFGAVLRNSIGDFIAGKSGSLTIHISIAEAEALLVRKALSWLKSLHYTHIVVEFDSIVLYEALTNHESDLSYYFSIIEDY